MCLWGGAGIGQGVNSISLEKAQDIELVIAAV